MLAGLVQSTAHLIIELTLPAIAIFSHVGLHSLEQRRIKQVLVGGITGRSHIETPAHDRYVRMTVADDHARSGFRHLLDALGDVTALGQIRFAQILKFWMLRVIATQNSAGICRAAELLQHFRRVEQARGLIEPQA